MKNKYVLIGIPTCGKSTIGHLAAEKLGIPFYNTDKMALERADFDYSLQVMTFSGQDRFIAEQRQVIRELAELDGAGIVEVWPENAMRSRDVDILKKIGTIIYIKRDLEAALADDEKKEGRIVWQEVNTGKVINMHAEGIRLYAEECYRYEYLADLTIDNNGSIDEAVEKLVAMIREREK